MDVGTLELVDLESLLDGEASCEWSHVTTVCTWTVVAVVTWVCEPTAELACQSARQWVIDGIDSGGYCDDCGRPCQDCWSVRPV